MKLTAFYEQNTSNNQCCVNNTVHVQPEPKCPIGTQEHKVCSTVLVLIVVKFHF